MSRINDALKQARESQPNQPPAGVPPLTPLARTTGGIGWILPAVVALLLVTAGIFIGVALFKHPPAPVVAPVASAPAIPVAQPKPVEPAPIAAVAAVTVQTNQVPATNIVAAMVPPAAPPALKLQCIFADPKRPWAIVSGQTVFVGDALGDFRVAEISQKVIILKTPGGTVKKLTLPE
jgi:hypothetical protein